LNDLRGDPPDRPARFVYDGFLPVLVVSGTPKKEAGVGDFVVLVRVDRAGCSGLGFAFGFVVVFDLDAGFVFDVRDCAEVFRRPLRRFEGRKLSSSSSAPGSSAEESAGISKLDAFERCEVTFRLLPGIMACSWDVVGAEARLVAFAVELVFAGEDEVSEEELNGGAIISVSSSVRLRCW
jgi:hypothetical protein